MFVVAGVSGNTGSVVAQALLDAKQKVRVIVRDAAKGESWKKKGAEVAVADLADAKALARALEGAKAAYLLIPPPAPGTVGIVERAHKIVNAIGDAVGQGKLEQVVFLSSVGADIDTSGIVKTLHSAEQKLGAGQTPFVFLRAGYFMENHGASVQGVTEKGELATFLSQDKKIAMVATRDIGALAARLLLDPATPGKKRIVYPVGPQDYSLAEVGQAFGKVLGKPVKVAVFPTQAMVPVLTGFGMSAEIAALYQEMTEALNSGRMAVQPDGEVIRGKVGIEEFLAGMLKKPAAAAH